MLADAVVEDVDAPGIEVDALDASAGIARRLEGGHLDVAMPLPVEAAVVADVAGPVRPDRGAVGAAPGPGDDARRAGARVDPGEGAAPDLDDEQRSVGRNHRSFRELQSFGQDPHRAVSSLRLGVGDYRSSAGARPSPDAV
jgi:hypothetical protein